MMSRNARRLFHKIEHGFAAITNRRQKEISVSDLTDAELLERLRALTQNLIDSWRAGATQADVRTLLLGLDLCGDVCPDILDQLSFQEVLDLGIAWPNKRRLGRAVPENPGPHPEP